MDTPVHVTAKLTSSTTLPTSISMPPVGAQDRKNTDASNRLFVEDGVVAPCQRGEHLIAPR